MTAASSTTWCRCCSARCWPPSLALLIATPLSIGIALFISHYAPRRLARTLGYVIDLLAAIPSVIYGLWGALVLAPYVVPSYQWLERQPGLPAALRRARHQHRPHDPHRRDRAGGDDPADHGGHQPRGLPADARAARGGGAGARRHALGDDPDDGHPVRPVRHRQRRHARPRPRARRDDRRAARAVRLRRHHLQPHRPGQPADHPVEHRRAVPRGHRPDASTC